MQAVIWIFSVLGVIGAGIGLGYLIYYLFWPKYAIKSEESVTRSEFEEFKADIEAKLKEGVTKPSELDALKTSLEAIEAKLKEGVIKPSELDALKTSLEAIEAKLKEGVIKPSELDALKTSLEAIEAKLKEEYVTLSKFDRFRDAIREIM